jgi:hypothetical protein
MIFGKLDLTESVLHTHADSYILVGIKKVSTARPFLSSAVMIAGLAGLFALGFADILYVHELMLIGAVITAALMVGFSLAQLRLFSRDLYGAQAINAVYGTYRHLNQKRIAISAAVEAAKSGGAS